MLETITDTHAEIATIEKALAMMQMQEALKKGAKLLAEHVKLIKIADRSKFG